MSDAPRKVWVFDTSSIIEIRPCVRPRDRRKTLDDLTAMVNAGELRFPKQVVPELGRYISRGKPNEVHEWAKDNRPKACRHGNLQTVVREMLQAQPQVAQVVDAEKLGGVEEADIYVLALGIHLQQQGKIVTVVTEEKNDEPDKLSLNSACGLLGLPSLPMRPFLRSRGLDIRD